MVAAVDRGEPVSMMEPMLVSESSRHRGPLADRAVDLAGKAMKLIECNVTINPLSQAESVDDPEVVEVIDLNTGEVINTKRNDVRLENPRLTGHRFHLRMMGALPSPRGRRWRAERDG